MHIVFRNDRLTTAEQSVVTDGFASHTEAQGAPDYNKEHVSWLAFDDDEHIVAALTGDVLWDWLYVDELWVSVALRGESLGRRLMQLAEEFAVAETLQGIWLWTQSWQAEGFYERLGYREFTRFDDFPKGHSRIGLRKKLS